MYLCQLKTILINTNRFYFSFLLKEIKYLEKYNALLKRFLAEKEIEAFKNESVKKEVVLSEKKNWV